MRWFCPGLAAMALTAPVLLAGVPADAASRVGVSAAVRGVVEVDEVTSETIRRASTGENMFLGDVVDSHLESGMQILLLDETTFTVGENCRITIDKFVYDPETGAGEVAATVTEGFFRFVSGSIAANDPSAMTIRTPAANLGIRGTIGDGVVGRAAYRLAREAGLEIPGGGDPDKAFLAVLRGPGQNRNTMDKIGRFRIDSGGKTVEVARANWATFVAGPDVPPVAPFQAPLGLLQTLTTSVRAAAGGGPAGGGDDESAARSALKRVPAGAKEVAASILSGQDTAEATEDAIQTIESEAETAVLDEQSQVASDQTTGRDPGGANATTFEDLRSIPSGQAVFVDSQAPLSDGGTYSLGVGIDFATRHIVAGGSFQSRSFSDNGAFGIIPQQDCLVGCDFSKGTGPVVVEIEHNALRPNANGDEVDFGRLVLRPFNEGGLVPARFDHELQLQNEKHNVTGSGTATNVPLSPSLINTTNLN